MSFKRKKFRDGRSIFLGSDWRPSFHGDTYLSTYAPLPTLSHLISSPLLSSNLSCSHLSCQPPFRGVYFRPRNKHILYMLLFLGHLSHSADQKGLRDLRLVRSLLGRRIFSSPSLHTKTTHTEHLTTHNTNTNTKHKHKRKHKTQPSHTVTNTKTTKTNTKPKCIAVQQHEKNNGALPRA